jgi:uncharacterized repeat protein (TIGR01451 family)
MTNSGGTAGIAVVQDDFPAGLEPANWVGYGGAAYFNGSGDLDETITGLGTNGTATYDCAAKVVDPVLSVTTTPSVSNTSPGGTVTYSIEVENVSGADVKDVIVADSFIPLGSCTPNPTVPFNVGAGQTETFVCSGVTITSGVTNTTTVTGTLPLTNTATVSGTSAVLQDTVVTLIMAVDSDQTTVTADGFKVYLPAVRKVNSPFTPVAPVGLALILPVAGIGLVMKRRRG